MPRDFSAIGPAVRDIIESILLCKPYKVIPESMLVEDLGADSLDITEIRIEIEDTLKISITDAEWDAVKTVGDATALATRKKMEGP